MLTPMATRGRPHTPRRRVYLRYAAPRPLWLRHTRPPPPTHKNLRPPVSKKRPFLWATFSALTEQEIFMKTNRKGFTLIELMIVVAIIGILAAVAIPGFMRYIKSSKTTEATTNMKAIADGAITWFQAEHPADGSGLVIYTKSYPGCEAGVATPAACSTSNTLGNAPAASTVGVKNSVSDDLFKAQPWARLKFSISKPFYYHYSYGSVTGQDGAGRTIINGFSAGATAALSNATDNTGITGDSAFQIIGSASGAVGAIVDVSDSATKKAVTDNTGLTGDAGGGDDEDDEG